MSLWDKISGGNATEAADPTAVIERLCRSLDWKVDERHGHIVRLFFGGEELDGRRTVGVICRPRMCTFFSVSRSDLQAEKLPGDFPPAVLSHNSDCTLGAWEMDVDDEDGELTFSCSYRVPPSVLTPEFFKLICHTLVHEAAEFDRELKGRGLWEDD